MTVFVLLALVSGSWHGVRTSRFPETVRAHCPARKDAGRAAQFFPIHK